VCGSRIGITVDISYGRGRCVREMLLSILLKWDMELWRRVMAGATAYFFCMNVTVMRECLHIWYGFAGRDVSCKQTIRGWLLAMGC